MTGQGEDDCNTQHSEPVGLLGFFTEASVMGDFRSRSDSKTAAPSKHALERWQLMKAWVVELTVWSTGSSGWRMNPPWRWTCLRMSPSSPYHIHRLGGDVSKCSAQLQGLPETSELFTPMSKEPPFKHPEPKRLPSKIECFISEDTHIYTQTHTHAYLCTHTHTHGWGMWTAFSFIDYDFHFVFKNILSKQEHNVCFFYIFS